MLVLKQRDSFRLIEFESLSSSIQRSMLFSRHGRQTGLLDIGRMSKHDIVRVTAANGSITLLEIVDPSNGTVLIYSTSSPYLMHQYCQSGRYLGRCYLSTHEYFEKRGKYLGECYSGSFIEGGDNFCFLDKKARMHRIWKIQKIEILEERSGRQGKLHLINLPRFSRMGLL